VVPVIRGLMVRVENSREILMKVITVEFQKDNENLKISSNVGTEFCTPTMLFFVTFFCINR
jgi:hypothetical protein